MKKGYNVVWEVVDTAGVLRPSVFENRVRARSVCKDLNTLYDSKSRFKVERKRTNVIDRIIRFFTGRRAV